MAHSGEISVDLLQALGTLMSFTAFGLVAAGVMKAFHISNDLGEVKELLRDIRRSVEERGPAPARKAQAEETLLREMSESEYIAAIQERAKASAPAPSPVSAAPLMRAVNHESQTPALNAEVLNARTPSDNLLG